MNIHETALSGVLKIVPRRFEDERGFFMETFRQNLFAKAAGDQVIFLQDNHSFSKDIGTVRGLHYQKPPFAQGKLVRCTRGRINDIAVDIRNGSPSYGQYVSVELSAENNVQLWIPPGFLHGFSTLEADTEVCYKCTNYYDGGSEGSVIWNDSELGIYWGIDPDKAILSKKDAIAASFKDLESPFSI